MALLTILLRARPDGEWHPMSYEHGVRMPDSVLRRAGEALTPDKHLMAPVTSRTSG